MKTIYKFPLKTQDIQDIETHPWEPLSVGYQRGVLCLWAKVNTDRPKRTRRVVIRGTGHELGDDPPFLGTVQSEGGFLIWHIFADVDNPL